VGERDDEDPENARALFESRAEDGDLSNL